MFFMQCPEWLCWLSFSNGKILVVKYRVPHYLTSRDTSLKLMYGISFSYFLLILHDIKGPLPSRFHFFHSTSLRKWYCSGGECWHYFVIVDTNLSSWTNNMVPRVETEYSHTNLSSWTNSMALDKNS